MSENRSLTATFELQPPETYSLELESSPSQGGRTSGTGAYSYGETINISAVALPGYVFEEWIGQGIASPNEPDTSVVLSGNFYLFAKFKPSGISNNCSSLNRGCGFRRAVFIHSLLLLI